MVRQLYCDEIFLFRHDTAGPQAYRDCGGDLDVL